MRARRVAQLRGSYRYGAVLLLAVISTGSQMVLPDTPAAWFAEALLMALMVLTALLAEGATRTGWRRMWILLGLALAALVANVIAESGQAERAIMFSLSGVLAAVGAVVIARGVVIGIRVERRVTLHSVIGVLTVYLLAGLIFAFVYGVMDHIAGSPVLSNSGTDKHAAEVYFSYITLATVGYGDIAPVASAARMTAAFEALFGQFYLVTIVAVIVSNVGVRRSGRFGADSDSASSS